MAKSATIRSSSSSTSPSAKVQKTQAVRDATGLPASTVEMLQSGRALRVVVIRFASKSDHRSSYGYWVELQDVKTKFTIDRIMERPKMPAVKGVKGRKLVDTEELIVRCFDSMEDALVTGAEKWGDYALYDEDALDAAIDKQLAEEAAKRKAAWRLKLHGTDGVPVG